MNEKVDGFKCRTCGFVAFGENSSTAKYKECLGCGNLMGDDPAVKQTASSSEVSLLESCNNCKHQFSTRASVCPKCNHERTSECFVCKKQIAKNSTSCPECGDPSPFELQDNSKQKSELLQHQKNNTQNISTISGNKNEELLVNNPVLAIVKKSIIAILFILGIIALFSPLKTIILQAGMILTGLLALFSGKLWFMDEKYTIKNSTARLIGALLVSSVPLSILGGVLSINKYGYTSDAKNYGTITEVIIFCSTAFVAYVVYRFSREIKHI